MLPACVVVISGWVLFEKEETTCSVQNSCSLVDQILTCFALRVDIYAGLRVALFSFSYMHSAIKHVKHKILPELFQMEVNVE
jgi:hypothetical protein